MAVDQQMVLGSGGSVLPRTDGLVRNNLCCILHRQSLHSHGTESCSDHEVCE